MFSRLVIQLKEKSVSLKRHDRKEALSEEDANRIAGAIQRIGNCFFPLLQVLRDLELPQATLDAAKLLNTSSGYVSTAGTTLQRVLSRPSRCSWTGEVEDLAIVLTVLLEAWPAEESCKRLVQREGDPNALSHLEQKASCPEGNSKHRQERIALFA